jgi:hypothetical protein
MTGSFETAKGFLSSTVVIYPCLLKDFLPSTTYQSLQVGLLAAHSRQTISSMMSSLYALTAQCIGCR